MVGTQISAAIRFSWAAHGRWPTAPSPELEFLSWKLKDSGRNIFPPSGLPLRMSSSISTIGELCRTRPPIRDISTDAKGALEEAQKNPRHYSLIRRSLTLRLKRSDEGFEGRTKDPLPEYAQRVEILAGRPEARLLSTRLQEFLDFESDGGGERLGLRRIRQNSSRLAGNARTDSVPSGSRISLCPITSAMRWLKKIRSSISRRCLEVKRNPRNLF